MPITKKFITVFKLIGMSFAKGDLSMKINLEILLAKNVNSYDRENEVRLENSVELLLENL